MKNTAVWDTQSAQILLFRSIVINFVRVPDMAISPIFPFSLVENSRHGRRDLAAIINPRLFNYKFLVDFTLFNRSILWFLFLKLRTGSKSGLWGKAWKGPFLGKKRLLYSIYILNLLNLVNKARVEQMMEMSCARTTHKSLSDHTVLFYLVF